MPTAHAAAPLSLEDIFTLIAGRPELVHAVCTMDNLARRFVADSTRDFLDTELADELVAGCFPDAQTLPGYVDVVMQRLRRLADY